MCYKYFSRFVYHYVTQFPIYFNPPCKQLECLHNMPEYECEGTDQLLPLGGRGVCVCFSRSAVSDSLWLHRLYPTRLLRPWDFPGKNTGVGSLSLRQEIFLTQGSNLGLLHWQEDSLLSEPPGKSTVLSTLLEFSSCSLSFSVSLSLSDIMNNVGTSVHILHYFMRQFSTF